MSIKGRLIVLFLILSLVPMAFISIYSTQEAGKALTGSAKLYLQSKAQAFEKIVEQEVSGRELTGFLRQAIVMTLEEKAAEEKYFDNGFMALMNSTGDVMYHKNTELVEQNIADQGYFQKAIENKNNFYTFVDDSGKKNISYVAYNESLDLLMWAIVPEGEIVQAANTIRFNLILVIAAVGIVIVLVALFFANSISNPIRKLADNITHMAEHLDFTALTIGNFADRKDEIGALTASFMKMVDNWKSVLLNTNQVAQSLLESSTQLAEAAEDSSAASEEVSASIEEVANRASDQTTYLGQANQAVNDLIAKLNNSSVLGKEAYQLANSTMVQASQGQKSVTNVIDQMENINNVIGSISDVVSNLVYKSGQIGEIVNLIDSIANQTQLLALNAAIEAARAGEAGRGFSVVADEIKQLAEESMKSANKIKELIKETQDESNKASNAMELGKKQVKTGSQVVDEAGSLFDKIIQASSTNLSGTKQTMDALEAAIHIADSIIDRVHEVAGIAEETSASAQQVSASTEEQTATMEQVSASASLLKELAKELQNSIAKFKLN